MSDTVLISRAAIIAAILRTVAEILSVPRIFTQMMGISRTSWWWTIWPLTFAGLAVDVIFALFCIGVFRGGNRILVPPNQRLTARTAGFALVLLVVLTDQYFGLGGQFWAQPHDAGLLHDLRLWFIPAGIGGTLTLGAYLTGHLGLISYGVLLTGLSRSQGDSHVAVPGYLRSITRLAAVIWGVISVGAILRLFAMPYVYSDLFRVARSYGRTPLTIESVIIEEIRILFPWLCLFVGPYVILRGFPKRAPETIDPNEPIPLPLGN